MSGVVDVLRGAREHVARTNGWIQRVYARDANGEHVSSYNKSAVCWCAEGAIIASLQSEENEDTFEKTAALLGQAIGCDSIPRWNDAPDRTQADVIAAFDKAIALAEGERS